MNPRLTYATTLRVLEQLRHVDGDGGRLGVGAAD